MTETSLPPVPETENMTPAPSSPWVMLVSMLLLISGLILSSAMLLHYALDGKEGTERNSLFDFVQLTVDGKKSSAKPQAAKTQGTSDNESSNPEASSSSVKTFFSGGGNGTVRWPKLKLSGFGTSSDTAGGFAIINGKHVLVNTSIGDVMLVEILAQGAVVEYKGERKILAVEPIH